MPFPPAPIRYRCLTCGWSQTVAPQSDALMPGERKEACPRCGHAPLDARPATRWLEPLRAQMARIGFTRQDRR